MNIYNNSNIETIKPVSFKPTIIPDGFVLAIDTREQRPLFKTPQKGLVIIYKTLKHGDYSIVGYENQICIERKQMSDLMSYMGKERNRTKLKILAMEDFVWKALLVETNDLFGLPMYTQLNVNHLMGFIHSIKWKHNFELFHSANRDALQRWILDNLVHVYTELRK